MATISLVSGAMQRITRSTILMIAIAAMFISPFLAVISAENTFAANYKDMNAIQRIKARDAVTILNACMNYGTFTVTSIEGRNDPASWRFISSTNISSPPYIEIPAYYIVRDNDLSKNNLTCNEFFQHYSTAMNISSPSEFLNGLDMKRDGNGSYVIGASCGTYEGSSMTSNAANCLRGAVYRQMGITGVPPMDAQMLYVRNKTILDARENGSDPGGCYAHWKSNTNSSQLELEAWFNERTNNNSYPDGILGDEGNWTKINLVDNSQNPTKTAPYLVMSAGGDGNDGWQKRVTLAPRINNVGETGRCVDLANYLSQTASANYVTWKADPANANSETGTTPAAADNTNGEATSTCQIEGVGWIVCPALNFIATITDAIYSLVSSWLTIDVTLLDSESGTRRGWGAMRDIANVGLAIVFIIVIYSQLTGLGISNYGVKKLLPRFAVMAILINASFFITQFMVDLSNIAGVSVKDFFGSAAVFDNNVSGFLAEGNTFVDVGTSLLAGAAVTSLAAAGVAGSIAYGSIGLFIMVVLSAVIAVAVTLLILAVRQALVVILIVVAPLAFLAMLLPNTKKWYDTWQKYFVSMLVIFPMIALVFGASTMAANILVSSDVILGLAVATVPLFAVIPMLKGSLKAIPIAGNLASKLSSGTSLKGNIKNRGKQAGKNFSADMKTRALRTTGDGKFGLKKAGRWIAGSSARGATRDRRFGTELNIVEADYAAKRVLDSKKKVSERDRAAVTREQAAAYAALDKIQEEEISNIVTLDSRGGGKKPDELLARIASSTATAAEKIAAVRQIEAIGGMSNRMAMAKIIADGYLAGQDPDTAAVRKSIVSSTAKMSDANPSYGGETLKKMQAGEVNFDQAHNDHVKSKQFSARSLLGMHAAAREELLTAVKDSGDAESKAALKAVQTQIENNPDLFARADRTLLSSINEAIGESPSAAGTQTVDVVGTRREPNDAREQMRADAAAQSWGGGRPAAAGSGTIVVPHNNSGTPPAVPPRAPTPPPPSTPPPAPPTTPAGS